MSSQSSGRDPVEKLAEEFVERYRGGESPSIEEYAAKYPDLAPQIRELFPSLLAMEQFGSVGGQSTGPFITPTKGSAAGMLLGEYRILREVGRGGMGVVYEAMQASLGRHVALKVLPFHGATNAIYRERFRREARAAAMLHHTNIVPVFGVGEHEGVLYYAMQFIQGQGLDAVLREVKRLQQAKSEPTVLAERAAVDNATRSLALKLLTGSGPVASTVAGPAPEPAPPSANLAPRDAEPAPAVSESQVELAGQTEAQYCREVAQMALQVAEALVYAHHHGIIHRDIKPSNLLLDGDGTVWITDFGLAKAEGSGELTKSGDIVGTLRYMAPERFNGESDARSDVYALGVTLYEMTTLHPAFDGADRAQLIQQVMNENPPRPRQLDPHIPRDLETIILKAMAKDTGDRYATAAEMAEDLRRFLEDRPIQARRASLAERAWRWRRRNPALAAVGGLAAAALMATVVLSLGLALQQMRAKDEIEKEQQKTLNALKKIETSNADSTLDKHLNECDRGDVETGMLGLADCLGLTINAQAPDLEQGVRANLAAWRLELNPLRAVVAHPQAVMAVAFSPDGRTFLTGSRDGKAQRWDAASSEPVGAPLSQLGVIRAVAWSQDGKTIATGGGDEHGGWTWLWDAATGRRLFDQPLRHEGEVRAVAFSPDSKTLVTAGIDRTAQLWDVQTGQPLLKEPLRHLDQIQAAVFSPNGLTILTAGMDRIAHLWNAASGKEILQLKGHKGEIWAAAFSPDGKRIVTGGLDETALLWNADTGEPIGKPLLQHAGVDAVGFSPDGKTILAGDGSGRVLFWNVETGRPVGRPLLHASSVHAAAFGPDGKTGMTVLTGSDAGVARLWEVTLADPPNVLLGESNKVFAAVFSPDATTLITCESGSARLWSAVTGRPLPGGLLHHPGDLGVAAFSPDGRVVLTGGADEEIRLWQVENGEPLGAPLHLQGEVWTAAFSPDGRTIAACDASGFITFWDANTGKRLPDALPFQGTVQTLVYSPDGTLLLVGMRAGSGRLWRIGAGELYGRPLVNPQGCWAAAFSPDGLTCGTGSGDGTAQVWETATGKPIGPGLKYHDAVRAAVFSPDGAALFTGAGEGVARLWQTAKGKPIGPSMQLGGPILAVAIASDGRTLRACDGKTVQSVPLPAPVEGEPERIVIWTQVMTGMELEEDNAVRHLDAPTWQRQRKRLEEMGGSPMP